MCMSPQARRCARCGARYKPPGATSRADDAADVCPACGVEEALRDFRGLERIPLDRWPVSAPGRWGPRPPIDELRDEFIALAERVGRTLRPDGDWAPTLLIEGPAGRIVVGLGDLFDSQAHKELAAEAIIPALLRSEGAWAFGLVMTAWAVVGGEPSGMRPSEDPRRAEVLAVTVADSSVHQVWLADIVRTGDEPPRPANWRVTTAMTGLLVEPLRRALCPHE
jgi:hypothetical protein